MILFMLVLLIRLRTKPAREHPVTPQGLATRTCLRKGLCIRGFPQPPGRRLKSRFVRTPLHVSGSIRRVHKECVRPCRSLGVKMRSSPQPPAFADRSEGGEPVRRQTGHPRPVSQRYSTKTLKGLVIIRIRTLAVPACAVLQHNINVMLYCPLVSGSCLEEARHVGLQEYAHADVAA